MRFLHISDLHYLEDYKGKGGQYSVILNRMDDPFSQLDSLLENRERNYDFVIVSGDIGEYGETVDYISARKRLEERFACPLLTGSGNHDNKDNLIKAFDKKKTSGELFEVFFLNGLRVIMLDSSHPDYNDGFVSETSCNLLAEELKMNTGVPTLIVTHHHLISDQFTMDMAKYPSRLLEIMGNDDIIAILTGHTHHIYHGQLAGKSYHTTGSLSFVADSMDNSLCFYQLPSALEFEYREGRLSYRELISRENKKILQIWS